MRPRRQRGVRRGRSCPAHIETTARQVRAPRSRRSPNPVYADVSELNVRECEDRQALYGAHNDWSEILPNGIGDAMNEKPVNGREPSFSEDDIQREQLGPRGIPGKESP